MGGQAVSADEQVTTDTSIETSQVNTAAKIIFKTQLDQLLWLLKQQQLKKKLL